jgi:crotonobetainyl-CoA:carnitine CoA-transferase CaiB-like acyl-CoA transferase
MRYFGSLLAAASSLVARLPRDETGRKQRVEISIVHVEIARILAKTSADVGVDFPAGGHFDWAPSFPPFPPTATTQKN